MTFNVAPATGLPGVKGRLVECAIDGREAIDKRLNEIDKEWSRSRVLEFGLGAVILAGVGVGYAVTPWALIPVAVGGLVLIENSLVKRSGSGLILEKLGWRSVAERERERTMLKAIRGDFEQLPRVVDDEDRDAISRLEGEGGGASAGECATCVPVNHEAVREIIEIVESDHRAV